MFYFIDINGLKAPNIVGKDVFVINANWGATPALRGVYPNMLTHGPLTRETLLTGEGLSDVRYACKKGDSAFDGYACAALIMSDGWKISDDYPW